MTLSLHNLVLGQIYNNTVSNSFSECFSRTFVLMTNQPDKADTEAEERKTPGY